MSVNHVPMRHKLTGKAELLPEKYLTHPVFGHLLEEVRTTKPLNEVKSAKTLAAFAPVEEYNEDAEYDEPETEEGYN